MVCGAMATDVLAPPIAQLAVGSSAPAASLVQRAAEDAFRFVVKVQKSPAVLRAPKGSDYD
jgi:hypothetical protein